MNKETVFRTLGIFMPEGRLMEIRALPCDANNKKTWSGYFKNKENLWTEIQPFDSGYNLYFVFNEIDPNCYSMLQREKMLSGVESTTDNDIITRQWVVIDLDPNRKGKKINSSDVELETAGHKAVNIRNYLRDAGFSEPVIAMSGSGYHLCYKIDSWAATKENDAIVGDFLHALSILFSDDKVDVDEKVKNAARIIKLYGTVARKGSNTPERPHRESYLRKIPEEILPTDKAYFRKVIGSVLPPAEELQKPSSQWTFDERRERTEFNIDNFISRHGIKVHSDTMIGSTRRIILEECPFDSNHKAPDAAIFCFGNGVYGFTCFHSHCSQYHWKDFRLHFEPDAYDRKEYMSFQHKQRHMDPIGFAERLQAYVPEQETQEKGKKWLSLTDIDDADAGEIYLPTGVQSLDNAIGGLALGQVSFISGINGSGKTSFMNMVKHACMNAQTPIPIAEYSGEMRAKRVKRWMTQYSAGKGFVQRDWSRENGYYITSEIRGYISEWWRDKYFLFNNNYGNRWSELYKDIEQVIKDHGVKLIIIDNLMSLQIDDNKDKYSSQSGWMQSIIDIAHAYNVHIIVVVHPRKSISFLRKEDISGTADLTNMPDLGLIIHRVGRDFELRAKEFYDARQVAEMMKYGNVIECVKCRDDGSVLGRLFGLYYEVETRRFKNEPTENIIYSWVENTPYATKAVESTLPQYTGHAEIDPFVGGFQTLDTNDLPF